jgi:hypothetical protein
LSVTVYGLKVDSNYQPTIGNYQLFSVARRYDVGAGLVGDILDFGFWILDFGLQEKETDTVPTANPKSKIQNLKSKIQNRT